MPGILWVLQLKGMLPLTRLSSRLMAPWRLVCSSLWLFDLPDWLVAETEEKKKRKMARGQLEV